jgi:hypothetical protein
VAIAQEVDGQLLGHGRESNERIAVFRKVMRGQAGASVEISRMIHFVASFRLQPI